MRQIPIFFRQPLPSNFNRTFFLCCSWVIVAVIDSAQAQMSYVDDNATAGIQEFHMESGMGGGIVAADYDDDGDIDLFVPNGLGYPDQLYRNNGSGQFDEIALEAGVASTASSRVALWVDYNGDARLDLVVVGDCWAYPPSCRPSITVYKQNPQGTFDDVTDETDIVNPFAYLSDVNRDAHYSGISAGDINNDGYLDLVFAIWNGSSVLLLNDGDGTFTDISVSSNVGDGENTVWQYIMHDFDGDGLLDIYASVDMDADRLYINQGDNTFVDIAASAGVDHEATDMGVTLGDYDNDDDMDIFITNIISETVPTENVLYRNDTLNMTVQFQEMAVSAGVSETGWGWGCTFLDGNNDGLLDLAATNGYFSDQPIFPFTHDPSYFFLNQGGGPVTFADVSDDVGFNDTFWGSSLIAIDYNRDGHLDLVQTTQELVFAEPFSDSQLRLLKNVPDASTDLNNYIVIKPRMTGNNHRAIGATVHVDAGGASLMRLITAGTSFMGQEPAESHFGLGSATSVDLLTIKWPDGTESSFADVPANQELRVLQGDADNDGLSDGDEINIFLTDPLDWDSDADGIGDGDEVARGTDPNNAGDTPPAATWVDLRSGSGGSGTFVDPYENLMTAAANTTAGGLVCVLPGASSQIATINKDLRIEAIGGTVIIGSP